MRIDFREERRWKLVIARTLVYAVVEWHDAGSLEERVRRGICVLWKPDDRREEDESMQVDDDRFNSKDMFDGAAESKGNSTPGNDENSDDDSEVEQEKDRQAVLNALEPSAALQEALEDMDSVRNSQNTQDVQPKTEDVEDSSALHLAAVAAQAERDDAAPTTAPKVEEPAGTAAAMKTGARDFMISAPHPEPVAPSSTSKSKSKSNMYAHLRQQIAYSDLDKVFVDLDDLELTKGMSELTTEDSSALAPPPTPTDISAIFPDLQPYTLLDVPQTSITDVKKKDRKGDRDDPTKRIDDITYTKITPLSSFMLQKTTLLGPLEPAKHWRDGEWHDLEQTTIVADFDAPIARIVDDSISSSTSYK